MIVSFFYISSYSLLLFMLFITYCECIIYSIYIIYLYYIFCIWIKNKTKRKDLLIIPIPIETTESDLKSLEPHLNCQAL